MGGPAWRLPDAKAATAARLAAAMEEATDSRVVIPGAITPGVAGDPDSPLQPLLTLAHSDGGRCKHNTTINILFNNTVINNCNNDTITHVK